MASKLDGYSKRFTNNHPETGEIESGTVITHEQAKKMSEIFSTKIAELSRKEELGGAEATFVDRITDLSARNVVYCIEQFGLSLSAETEAGLKRGAAAVSGQSAEGSESLAVSLSRVTGGGVGVRANPDKRPLVEDFAASSVAAFGELVETAGGEVQIDNYLAGNLKNMLANYEMIEPLG